MEGEFACRGGTSPQATTPENGEGFHRPTKPIGHGNFEGALRSSLEDAVPQAYKAHRAWKPFRRRWPLRPASVPQAYKAHRAWKRDRTHFLRNCSTTLQKLISFELSSSWPDDDDETADAGRRVFRAGATSHHPTHPVTLTGRWTGGWWCLRVGGCRFGSATG